MNDFMFDEFNEVSAKQWKQKIHVDLKGADYNEVLVWESNEGIKVKPFYHQDEFEALDIPQLKKDTTICQSIFVSDEQTALFLAKDVLNRGATSIEFVANEAFDIDNLLGSLIVPANGAIYFKLNFLSESFYSELAEKINNHNVFINCDPIGHLVKDGNWFSNKEKDFQVIKNLLDKAPNNVNIISVDASIYQNAGASSLQQIAYALAHANEYLNTFANEGERLLKSVQFNFSVGSNYFFEIAKLRAFRYLWYLLCEEYGVKTEPHVLVTPSLRNKTLYDYNTNMLRTTTECMSALLGGANVVSNVSYDALYHRKNEFGERIARNQLLILQEESYFKEASKFTDGSYYVESLTKQLAEKSLEVFKDIERAGGFLKQLDEGTIQRKIAENAEKEQIQFDNGQEILLGTNKHPNPKDKMKGELELYPFVKTNPRKTKVQPIIAKRLAEKIDQERLEKES